MGQDTPCKRQQARDSAVAEGGAARRWAHQRLLQLAPTPFQEAGL